MGTKWTKSQKNVIDLREKNILVSAAAGSGKTAVLVERIIQLVTDEKHPVDIDKMLIMTFSKAAAGEMKERILQAIDKKAKETPENTHIQKQLTYIHNANISTIHSFCQRVIRDHYSEIDIDPAFSVRDENDLKLMQEDVLQELLEEKYLEKEEGFLRVVEQYTGAKSDEELPRLILQLSKFASSYPYPEKWLDECVQHFEFQSEEEFLAADWMKNLVERINTLGENLFAQMERVMDMVSAVDGLERWIEGYQPELIAAEALSKAKDFYEIRSILSNFQPNNMNSFRAKAGTFAENMDEIKKLRGNIKDDIQKLKIKYTETDLEEQMECMKSCGESAKVLVELTREFMRRYADKKHEKNVMEFSDLEHFALQILQKEDGSYTQAADELAKEYQAIMVDEYQDSNFVQEALIQSVSGERFGKPNVFMVGDVKQSIYKFRLAKPELFMEKYEAYPKLVDMSENDKLEGVNRRINLDMNFRSRAEILNSTNFIFEYIMGKDLGGIEYDEEHQLNLGADYPEVPEGQNQKTEIVLLMEESEAELEISIKERKKEEIDILAIAKKIQEMVGVFQVWDKKLNQYRPCRYSDIAILLRKGNKYGDLYANVLEKEHIPAYCDTSEGYYSAIEVVTVLNMLRVIDNPRQDIPLVAVLSSPMYGVTNDMLGKIRCLKRGKKILFYEACEEYMRKGKDQEIRDILALFFEQLEEYRSMMIYADIYQLITKILEDTGYQNYVQALTGGKRRSANLEMLKQQAIQFENSMYQGLFQFVRYIEKLEKYSIDVGEASVISENEDTVRIMSIHKSKGLEFPVVMVAAMHSNFPEFDARGDMIIHPNLGVSTVFKNPELRVKLTPWHKHMMEERIREDNLGEELRLLYVAMTRAKEKLILFGRCNLEKKESEWNSALGFGIKKISPVILSKSHNFLDLFMYGYTRCLCHSIECHVLSYADIVEKRTEKKVFLDQKRLEIAAVEDKEMYEERLHTQVLKHLQVNQDEKSELIAGIPSKLSVTQLKERSMHGIADLLEDASTHEAADLLEDASTHEAADLLTGQASEKDETEKIVDPYMPEFLRGKQELKGAERGTAYHRVLELLDYNLEPTVTNYKKMLEGFVENNRLEEAGAACIYVKDIVTFANTQLGQRMKQAFLRGELYREAKFVMSEDSSVLEPKCPGEQILVQGIIDAFFIEENEIVIVDYKTDWVERLEELKDRYHVQLEAYAQAVSQIMGMQVKECIIYSVHFGDSIHVFKK